MDHLLTKFQKYRTETFGAINVLVTSLLAISDPKVAIVCESIKGKLLNGNAYKTQVRRKMTSSTRWLSRILDISWFWPPKIQKHLFYFWINPRPAGSLDFPPPAGGGGRLNAPMISSPGRRREKRKAAFESSRKIISKSFRSFFDSGQNWGPQGSKFQNIPKRFFGNKIVNFKGRATNLTPSCLSR